MVMAGRKRGGQPGNKNAANTKEWKDALHYALVNYENKEQGIKKRTGSQGDFNEGCRKGARRRNVRHQRNRRPT